MHVVQSGAKPGEGAAVLRGDGLSLMAFAGVCAKPLSCVRLSVTPWTVAYQAPPSLGF